MMGGRKGWEDGVEGGRGGRKGWRREGWEEGVYA
jgi:hypothetical protein